MESLLESLMKQVYPFHEMVGKRILIIGMGGGCDIISAYALSKVLPRGVGRVAWGNVKHRGDPDLIPMTPNTRDPYGTNPKKEKSDSIRHSDPHDFANRGKEISPDSSFSDESDPHDFANRNQKDFVNLNWKLPGIYRLPDNKLPLNQVKDAILETKIDRTIHQGHLSSNKKATFVLLLPKINTESEKASNCKLLAKELVTLCSKYNFDSIIGIDSGGDAFVAHSPDGEDRDQQSVHVIQATKLPSWYVVFAPGSDGTTKNEIESAFKKLCDNGLFCGSFSLVPLLTTLEKFGKPLAADRTPNIMCDTMQGPPYKLGVVQSAGHNAVQINRGQNPIIPISWLSHGFVFKMPAT